MKEERKTSDGICVYKTDSWEKKLAKEETIGIKNKIITDRFERELEENRRLALRLIVVGTKPDPSSSLLLWTCESRPRRCILAFQ